MALFVVQNIGPLKFHLLGLEKSDYDKYRKLITENGGEVSLTGNYPVINFSLPGCFQDHEFVIHVRYIEDCIKENRILNLIDFIISEKNGYEGCPLSSLIFGDLRCKLALAALPLTLSGNDVKSRYKTTQDTKRQKIIESKSVDKPLEKSITLVEYIDDDDDDNNKNNENENTSDNEKIEDSLINEQNPTGSPPNYAKGDKCRMREVIHGTKILTRYQFNKKLNSSSNSISPQAPQPENIDHMDLSSDDEMKIVPENSVPQSIGSTMVMDVITDDEDTIPFEDDKLLESSAYEAVSSNENNSILSMSHEHNNTSNDSVISNSTDDSLGITRSGLSYRKFSNLKLMKD